MPTFRGREVAQIQEHPIAKGPLQIFDRFQGNRTCRGPRDARLCSWKLAEQIGISSTLPRYSEQQRLQFLERFVTTPVQRAGVRPTPWS